MRKRGILWRYLFVLLVLFLFYSLLQKESEEYLVIRVLDGDTIELAGKEKVRYIGVDAPELGHSQKEAEYYAQEAYRINRELVEGKKVTLEFDVQKRDRYGRMLAYVYVDGLMVNEWLVANGYARVATFPPNVKYADRFRQLEREARRKGFGLWAK
ncbi:MAG: thermonuclease family protein [Candidatus Caldatribacteriaceae bacterium]